MNSTGGDDAYAPFLTTFGSSIKEFRQAIGISQRTLARRTGFHLTYIEKIERQGGNATLQSLATFSQALGIAPSVLLTKAFARLPEPTIQPLPLVSAKTSLAQNPGRAKTAPSKDRQS